MAYQVLARKYRPQSFTDVIGQRGVTQTLRNAIATDRLAQAFVFAGPAGRGEDDDRSHSRQGPQLRERPDSRSVRDL